MSGVRHEEEKYPALCPLSMNKSKDGFITAIHRHSRISPKCVLEPEQKMKSERQRQVKVNPRVTKLSCTGHLWEGWSTNSFHPHPQPQMSSMVRTIITLLLQVSNFRDKVEDDGSPSRVWQRSWEGYKPSTSPARHRVGRSDRPSTPIGHSSPLSVSLLYY